MTRPFNQTNAMQFLAGAAVAGEAGSANTVTSTITGGIPYGVIAVPWLHIVAAFDGTASTLKIGGTYSSVVDDNGIVTGINAKTIASPVAFSTSTLGTKIKAGTQPDNDTDITLQVVNTGTPTAVGLIWWGFWLYPVVDTAYDFPTIA